MVTETQRWTLYTVPFLAEWQKEVHMPVVNQDLILTWQLTGMVTAKKVKCFIATAAYGSSLYPELNILRIWRDNTLGRNRFGQVVISLYYTLSPPFASIITRSHAMRRAVRGVLNPIIKSIYRRHPKWREFRGSKR